MNKIRIISMSLLLMAVVGGCKKNEENPIDKTYPEIQLGSQNSFPKQCSVIKRGESFTFRALLTDNSELGSLSIDIHQNFDHHSHSTEVDECTMSPVKLAVKPFQYIKNYPITAGLKSYEANEVISVPADIDPGDYHFLIKLTDKEGWQTLKGISIRIE